MEFGLQSTVPTEKHLQNKFVLILIPRLLLACGLPGIQLFSLEVCKMYIMFTFKAYQSPQKTGLLVDETAPSCIAKAA